MPPFWKEHNFIIGDCNDLNIPPVPAQLWNCTGLLNKGTFGTATIVGNQTILTAAHVVYKSNFIRSCVFNPLFPDLGSDAGVACAKVYIPSQYVNTYGWAYDYALIQLAKPLFWPACSELVIPEHRFTGENATLYGYLENSSLRYERKDSINSIDAGRGTLGHSIRAGNGFSGGGILYNTGSKIIQIGIHVKQGTAVMINRNIIDKVNEIENNCIV